MATNLNEPNSGLPSLVVAVVNPPFDDRKADVILRSCDGVDFRMFKSLLSFASPFFEGMLALPQPAASADSVNETKDGLPIIQIPEKSGAVEKLLMFCHPACAPILQNLDEIQEVLAPAIKYDMVGVVKRVGEMLKPFAEKEPMRVFCITWQHRLEDEARVAAKHMLRLPIFPRPYVRELESITAGTLHRLEGYHYRCGKAARAIATSFGWISLPSLIQFGSGCWNCSRGATVTVLGGQLCARNWWMDYMRDASDALVERPCGATVKGPEIMNKALKKASECAQCRERVFVEMTEFSDLFAAEVEKATSCVSAIVRQTTYLY